MSLIIDPTKISKPLQTLINSFNTLGNIHIGIRISGENSQRWKSEKLLKMDKITFVHVLNCDSSFQFANGIRKHFPNKRFETSLGQMMLTAPNFEVSGFFDAENIENGHINTKHRQTASDLQVNITSVNGKMNGKHRRTSRHLHQHNLHQSIRHRRDMSLSVDVKTPGPRAYSFQTANPESSISIGTGVACLVGTWIIFILGLAHIFDFWHVNIHLTQYTDYEEETGLPIPGYYFSMVILSSVVIWMWCISSWTGMKFFRHSTGRGREIAAS